jgi:hypothetical protein
MVVKIESCTFSIAILAIIAGDALTIHTRRKKIFSVGDAL